MVWALLKCLLQNYYILHKKGMRGEETQEESIFGSVAAYAAGGNSGLTFSEWPERLPNLSGIQDRKISSSSSRLLWKQFYHSGHSLRKLLTFSHFCMIQPFWVKDDWTAKINLPWSHGFIFQNTGGEKKQKKQTRDFFFSSLEKMCLYSRAKASLWRDQMCQPLYKL